MQTAFHLYDFPSHPYLNRSEVMDACPSCHQIDQVQKVSAIVSSGPFSSGTTHVSSNLAQRLSMPPAPTVTHAGGCSLVMLIIAVGWVAFIGALAIILSLAINNPGIASTFNIPPP